MAQKAANLLHRGVLPNVHLVVAVAVSRDQLVEVLSEGQVADLGPSVNGVDSFPGQGVSETDVPVGCPPSGGQQAVLVR